MVEENNKNNQEIIRKASHYYSWYMGPKQKLAIELENYLENAEIINENKIVKGMIVPHAGIMWSGATAAWGFKNIIKRNYKRIFIIGPSHFVDFKGIGLSGAEFWDTPFCKLKIDNEIYDKLKNLNKSDNKKKLFLNLPLNIDEYEHSLEIQTPYLGYLLQEKSNSVTIVPLLTGNLSYEEEMEYAEILLEYYNSDENLFIISEDFCHWGKRHNFFFKDNKFEKIHQSIEFLDQMAFDIIEKKESKPFKEYLEKWKNNLCGGGSPITIYLGIVERYKKENVIELRHYTKSNPDLDDENDEAVSYAVFMNFI